MKALVAALVLMAATASAQVTITPSSAVGGGGGTFTNPLLAPTTPTDCTAPQYSFQGATTTGYGYDATANQSRICSNGAISATFGNNAINLGGDSPIVRQGSSWVALRNSTTAQRFDAFNTYTNTTNNESFSIDWQTAAGIVVVGARNGSGGGNARRVVWGSQSTGALNLFGLMTDANNGAPRISIGIFSTAGVGNQPTTTVTELLRLGDFTSTITAGTVTPVTVQPTYNQAAATTSNTDFLINRTETAIGSGTQLLFDAQVAGVTKFFIDRNGNWTSAGSGTITGSLYQGGVYQMGSTSTASFGTGNVSASKHRAVTGIADAVATTLFTVTIPNASHTASIEIFESCSLGAGGAIGAGEATATVVHSMSIARTAGVATTVAATTYGGSTTSVAGGATITLTPGTTAVAGAVGATQTFTITVTVAHGSGASTNHTCRGTAELLNANNTGITIQ